jgi:exoribonuclease-2
MYLEVTPNFEVETMHSRVDRVHIAANLRHDTLEQVFNEATLSQGGPDYPYKVELGILWQLSHRLEALRGKQDDGRMQPLDYNFLVENDRVFITERPRGSPIDKVVSELMIYVNSQWGKLLADANVPGLYRCQSNGKVRMSTTPAPHQGLGVAQYAWSSSPLRRYVDQPAPDCCGDTR